MADTVNKTRLVAKTAKLRSTKIVDPPEPQKLGNYTLTTRLGSGGMGSVYRAHDDKLDRTVAIKVMLAKVGNSPEVMSAFRREAQAAAKLNHPNIAQIYSFGEEGGRPYIAMEYVSGDHFDKLIQREEPLDQAMVMKIGMDIAGGLAVAADASLIHGDIKPENIVFDDHGVPKLLDFGIALASNAKTTEVWGTPYYIAPEKLKKQRIDFRSDIYCLGGTLYHALTKHPPFDGDDVKEVVKARLIHPPQPLSAYRPDIDPEVEAIILRMLQVEPADRYPTYGALLNDIRKYLRRVRPQMIPVTTEMLFVTTQFIAEAAAEKAKIKPKQESPKAQTQTAKHEKKHLFSDFKSQLLLLLTLVAFFPYFIIFYSGMRSLTAPRQLAIEAPSPKPRAQGQLAISNEQLAIKAQEPRAQSPEPESPKAQSPEPQSADPKAGGSRVVATAEMEHRDGRAGVPPPAAVPEQNSALRPPPSAQELVPSPEPKAQEAQSADPKAGGSRVVATAEMEHRDGRASRPATAAEPRARSPEPRAQSPEPIAAVPEQNSALRPQPSALNPPAPEPGAQSPEPRAQGQLSMSNEQLAISTPPPAPSTLDSHNEGGRASRPATAAEPRARSPEPGAQSPEPIAAVPEQNSALRPQPSALNPPAQEPQSADPKAGGSRVVATAEMEHRDGRASRPAPAAVPEQNSALRPQPSALNSSSALRPQPSALTNSALRTPHSALVELPPIDEGPRQNWPELKVTATMGSGNNGSALVNGDVVSVGFSMQNGVKLTAVGPHYAEFCLKGEYKRVVVTAPVKKQGNGKKGKR